MKQESDFLNGSIHISRNHEDFIKLSESLARKKGNYYAVLSYLSSIHFSKSLITRFYEFADKKKRSKNYMDPFERIKRYFLRNIMSYKYHIVYSESMVKKFINSGKIHDEYRFFATPKEISAVINNIIKLLKEKENFNIALTKEIIPFVFGVKNEHIMIDIKENMISQKIQGIFIRNQEMTDYFREEYDRIWNSNKTIKDKNDIVKYLESLINRKQYYSGIRIKRGENYG